MVIGIDTGGTFTDGVLLDYRTRRILNTAKTLTTREDLAAGVVRVLSDLSISEPDKIRLVGISSTLATNSVAEGKIWPVGLLLVGYDRDLVASYGLESRFATPHYAFFSGGHTSQGREKEPLDTDGLIQWVTEHDADVEALAVSSYFSPLNPEHENRILAAIREVTDKPVVLGHQLSTKLDSIKRATTACLNASLVAVMQGFIEAVKQALESAGIDAPLMIVKGDGSLMPYTEAVSRPVETILSGPAASAMGGRFLSRQGTALVVDMGGTTTDMALIENSAVALSEDGARVGDIRTAVRAARIRTACVGCDSRIRVAENGEVLVGPDRVVPLSRLVSWHPALEKDILALSRKKPGLLGPNDFSCWFLYKPVGDEDLEQVTPVQRRLLKALEGGPQILSGLLSRLGVHHAVQLDASDLFRKGLVEEAGLTPTDLLHASGRLDKWNRAVAAQAVDSLCAMHGLDRPEFITRVMDLMVADIVEEAMVFMARAGQKDLLPEKVDGKWGRWLLEEALAKENPFLSVAIASRFPIIGIGAPAKIFVREVAEALRAPFVLPVHAEVANAVGAVAGSVVVDTEALLYTRETGGNRTYVVQFDDIHKTFSEYEKARQFAETAIEQKALERAAQAGAINPQVQMDITTEGSMIRLAARAAGNPRLSGEMDVKMN